MPFDVTQDRYGRTVALCFADDVNLSVAMVRAGMAWAFVRYSRDYVTQEAEAKAAGRACTSVREGVGIPGAIARG